MSTEVFSNDEGILFSQCNTDTNYISKLALSGTIKCIYLKKSTLAYSKTKLCHLLNETIPRLSCVI